MHRFALPALSLLAACVAPSPDTDESFPAALDTASVEYDSRAAVAGAVASPMDTAGFRTLINVPRWTRVGEPGLGPVKMGPVWTGALRLDSSAVSAPYNAARFDYRAGLWGGVSPGFVWSQEARTQNARELYVRAYYKWSDNFVGHVNAAKVFLVGFGPNGNQFVLLMKGSQGVASKSFALWPHFQGLGALPSAVLVGGQCCTDPKGGNWSGVTPANIGRGVWVKVELRFSAGTYQQRNASMRLWINDRLVSHATGFDITRQADTRFAVFKAAPVWGGGVSRIPAPQQLYLGELYVSGR